jgi:hypothetical protein
MPFIIIFQIKDARRYKRKINKVKFIKASILKVRKINQNLGHNHPL